MSSKPTKVYPVKGRWLHGVPTAVQVIETKAEADALIETGAFTDNPNHPDRDKDAADLSGDPVSFEEPEATQPSSADEPAGEDLGPPPE